MAMSTCRECQRGVSTEAAACPHCGAPQPATAVAISASGGGEAEQSAVVRAPRTKHLHHLILTVLTFGLWSPVWAASAYWDRWNRKREAVWRVGDRVALKNIIGGGGATGTIARVRPLRRAYWGPRLAYDVTLDGTHFGSSQMAVTYYSLRRP